MSVVMTHPERLFAISLSAGDGILCLPIGAWLLHRSQGVLQSALMSLARCRHWQILVWQTLPYEYRIQCLLLQHLLILTVSVYVMFVLWISVEVDVGAEGAGGHCF